MTTDARRRNLPILLLHAREQVIRRFRPVLQAHGITEHQYRILRAIQTHGPLEPREIVALCHISSPSLPGVLTRMQAAGLVTRQRLAHDQRRLHVSLTPASRRLMRRMWPRIEAVYRSIEAALGPDLAALYGTLDRVIERLSPVDAADDVDITSATGATS